MRTYVPLPRSRFGMEVEPPKYVLGKVDHRAPGQDAGRDAEHVRRPPVPPNCRTHPQARAKLGSFTGDVLPLGKSSADPHPSDQLEAYFLPTNLENAPPRERLRRRAPKAQGAHAQAESVPVPTRKLRSLATVGEGCQDASGPPNPCTVSVAFSLPLLLETSG